MATPTPVLRGAMASASGFFAVLFFPHAIPFNSSGFTALNAPGLVTIWGLEELLDFGSMTRMIACIPVAVVNLKRHTQTQTQLSLTVLVLVLLGADAFANLTYQKVTKPLALYETLGIHAG
ncbi:MAG: hypothetical protein QM477_06615 [Planctomycetota bacterium]